MTSKILPFIHLINLFSWLGDDWKCKPLTVPAILEYEELICTILVSLNNFDKEAQVTLQETECLGACQGAPVALVDDQAYHLDLTPEKINMILKELGVEEDGQWIRFA